MDLGPTEEERLRVFTAAELARRTLARGQRLNAPEAVALICDEMHMAARGGGSFDEVLDAGRVALAPQQVMDGVADLLTEVRLEVLLEDGSRLVVLRDPLGEPSGAGPGAVIPSEVDVALSPGRERRSLSVTNTSDRPVRVSSHYPFWRANARLAFDRELAHGFRLDVPAGSSVRWGPGETLHVGLVAYAGEATER
jgi:urease subunit gamma/beta